MSARCPVEVPTSIMFCRFRYPMFWKFVPRLSHLGQVFGDIRMLYK